MKQNPHTLQADKFKTQCLRLIDEVQERHISITITKNGKPVAKLVPIEEITEDSFGCLKGTLTITGDIVAPIDANWAAKK